MRLKTRAYGIALVRYCLNYEDVQFRVMWGTAKLTAPYRRRTQRVCILSLKEPCQKLSSHKHYDCLAGPLYAPWPQLSGKYRISWIWWRFVSVSRKWVTNGFVFYYEKCTIRRETLLWDRNWALERFVNPFFDTTCRTTLILARSICFSQRVGFQIVGVSFATVALWQ